MRNRTNPIQEAKELLNTVIEQEKQNGCSIIKELVSDRDPVEEIERVLSEEKINLIIMSAHEEGMRLEID